MVMFTLSVFAALSHLSQRERQVVLSGYVFRCIESIYLYLIKRNKMIQVLAQQTIPVHM